MDLKKDKADPPKEGLFCTQRGPTNGSYQVQMGFSNEINYVNFFENQNQYKDDFPQLREFSSFNSLPFPDYPLTNEETALNIQNNDLETEERLNLNYQRKENDSQPFIKFFEEFGDDDPNLFSMKMQEPKNENSTDENVKVPPPIGIMQSNTGKNFIMDLKKDEADPPKEGLLCTHKGTNHDPCQVQLNFFHENNNVNFQYQNQNQDSSLQDSKLELENSFPLINYPLTIEDIPLNIPNFGEIPNYTLERFSDLTFKKELVDVIEEIIKTELIKFKESDKYSKKKYMENEEKKKFAYVVFSDFLGIEANEIKKCEDFVTKFIEKSDPPKETAFRRARCISSYDIKLRIEKNQENQKKWKFY